MITVIMPDASKELEQYANQILKDINHDRIIDEQDIKKDELSKITRLLLMVQLDEWGQNLPLMHLLKRMDQMNPHSFSGCTAMFVVKSNNQWFTKSFASGLIFILNQKGCRFIGHPLLEMTKGLNNLNRWEKTSGIPREQLILKMGKQGVQRLLHFSGVRSAEPRVTVLHASSKKISNTLQLWHMVRDSLPSLQIDEFHVENGTLIDCIGCRYQTCLYYGRQKSCFYGGDMIKEIFPAMEKAQALVWVCPNYNDALSANLTAVINRMTALYRTMSFYDKTIFSVIVSGNSGSDSVARQLIGSLNVNKGFQLPPHFCLTATAYEPGSIMESPNIKKRAADFAAHINKELSTS